MYFGLLGNNGLCNGGCIIKGFTNNWLYQSDGLLPDGMDFFDKKDWNPFFLYQLHLWICKSNLFGLFFCIDYYWGYNYHDKITSDETEVCTKYGLKNNIISASQAVIDYTLLLTLFAIAGLTYIILKIIIIALFVTTLSQVKYGFLLLIIFAFSCLFFFIFFILLFYCQKRL